MSSATPRPAPTAPTAPAASSFVTGAVAALFATLVMFVLDPLLGTPLPPQLISDRLTALIPLELFSSLLGSLESAAKPFAFLGVILGQLFLGGLLAYAAVHLPRRFRTPGVLFVGLTVLVWAFLALVVAPLGGIGLLGRYGAAGADSTTIGFLISAMVYAGAVVLGLEELDAEPTVNTGRRRFLRLATFGIPAGLAVLYVGRLGVQLLQRGGAPAPLRPDGQMVSALTPTRDFYIVSKNFVDPSVAVDDWELTITGQVNQPQSYRYADLRQLPSVEETTTLECISNPVGGAYISTGRWTGVRLRDLLDAAGLKSGIVKIVLHAADDYADSIPLVAALHPNTLLAYDLNGEPLPSAHGFPLRLIVPGIFGMKNVKWITRIEAVDHDFRGYWQARGWSDVATVQTMSRIDVPADGRKLPLGQPTLIGGIAFSGDRGISKVEVSTDDGETWSPTALETPLSPLTWVLWTHEWTPTAPGSHRLVVRAYDRDGTLQTPDEQPPLPDGATGYHRIRVSVTEAAGA